MNKIKKSMFTILILVMLVGCTSAKEKVREEKQSYKVLSCNSAKFVNKNSGVTIKEQRNFYFGIDDEKLIKYFQKSFVDGIDEQTASENESLCEKQNDISGIYCSIEKHEENGSLTMKLEVVLAEIEDGFEYQVATENLKNATYEEAVRTFQISDIPWTCETYFE